MYCFLDTRFKLRWATNLDETKKSQSPKKRLLEYESSEEQLENTPLAKRQSPAIDTSPPSVSTPISQPSVIDDEELDFL